FKLRAMAGSPCQAVNPHSVTAFSSNFFWINQVSIADRDTPDKRSRPEKTTSRTRVMINHICSANRILGIFERWQIAAFALSLLLFKLFLALVEHIATGDTIIPSAYILMLDNILLVM